MHLLGGVAIAFFFWQVTAVAQRHNLIAALEGLTRIVLVFAMVASATVFWEFAEWISDHTIGTHAQGGLDDTLFDMLCGLIGGIEFVCLRAMGMKRE